MSLENSGSCHDIPKPRLYAELITKTCLLSQIRWSLSKQAWLVSLFAARNVQLVLSNLHLKLLLNDSIKIMMTVTAKYKKSKEKEKKKRPTSEEKNGSKCGNYASCEEPRSHIMYPSRQGGSARQTNLSRTYNSTRQMLRRGRSCSLDKSGSEK